MNVNRNEERSSVLASERAPFRDFYLPQEKQDFFPVSVSVQIAARARACVCILRNRCISTVADCSKFATVLVRGIVEYF